MDEFYSQCRACLQPLTQFIDLFDDQMLHLLINEFVPSILISKEDGLPQHICYGCFEDIHRLSQFRLKCEETNRKLLEIYELSKIEIMPEVIEPKKDPQINELVETYDLRNISKPKITEESKIIEVKIQCPNCREKVGDEEELTKHIDTHSCVSTRKCELCQISFCSKKSQRRHYQTSNHLSKTKAFRKEGVPFTKIRPYSCNICSKAYSRADHLKDHLRIHETPSKYQCDICLKCYNLKSVLKEHLLNHLGIGKALCSFCGKSFASEANLKQHILRHTQTKNYQCVTCSKTFISKGELNSHTRTHTGARPFICNVCGQGFTMSYSLVKHKRIHTGERPYVCTYCNKRFKILETLKIHTRIHTGEKPYACSFCQRAFTQKNDMVKHERIHRDQRLYGCPLCGKRFIQASTLNTHLKGVHKGETIILATTTTQDVVQPAQIMLQ